MVDGLIEQKIFIKMPQCGEFAAHRAAVHRVGKKLLNEIAHFIAAGGEERAALTQKSGELGDVGGVGGDGQRRQSLFDFQVVEEAGEDLSIGRGRDTN